MFGLSNYSVKKILPRLIIVAIAINLSFYICAALADASNMIGANVGQFIAGANGQVTIDNASGIDFILVSLAIIIIVIVAGASMLLALLMILILIALRTVVLTVLIVVSPVAFALYLLPNTENVFKKWLNEFVRMLLVYPMISAVFGGSILVYGMIHYIDSTGNGQDLSWLDWLIKAVLVVIPAVAIMPIMKMGGQVMSGLSGAVKKFADSSGASKWAQSSDELRRKSAMAGELGGNRFGTKTINSIGRKIGSRSLANKARGARYDRAIGRHYAEDLTNSEALLSAAAGQNPAERRLAQASALQAVSEEEQKQWAAAAILAQQQMNGRNSNGDWNSFGDVAARMEQAIRDGNKDLAHALGTQASKLATAGPELDRLMKAVKSMESPQMRVARDSLIDTVAGSSAYGKRPELGGAGMGWMNGTYANNRTLEQFTADRIPGNIKSGAIGSTINKVALEQQIAAATTARAGGDNAAFNTLIQQFDEAARTRETYKNIDDETRRVMESFVTSTGRATTGWWT